MNSLKNCSDAQMMSFGISSHVLKRAVSLLVISATCFSFTACGPAREEMEAKEARADANAILSAASEMVTDTINGISHNFIRTASLKCKVKDVLSATKDIEDIVAQQGGYISKSGLSSTVDYHNSIQVKKDSVMDLSYYNTINLITMRVPNRRLDTVIRKITGMALFIDYRNLSADDVKLKLAANKLEEARLSEFRQGLNKRSAAKKTKAETALVTESALLEKQDQIDETRIESYDLAEQVNYSTVTLEIYQEQKISAQVLAKPEMPEPYVKPFTAKMNEAFTNGFESLKSCLLFLLNSWGLILVLCLVFFFVKKLLLKNRQPDTLSK